MNERGKNITVFLIDGNEYGPRTIEIPHMSVKAIYSQRSALTNILTRDEFENPGVYILKSIPDDSIYTEKIYVGEAENLKIRIKQHLADPDKEEFNEFIGFISTNSSLTKSHIKYLESKIIALTKEAKTSDIVNRTTPSLPSLPEANISDLDYFLDFIKLTLPIVNIKALMPTTTKTSHSAVSKEEEKLQSKIYYIKKNESEITAQMYEDNQGIIVLSGSQCRKTESNSISSGWIKLRQKLIKSEVLIDQGKFYVFKEDTIFSSLSAASSIIMGNQTRGPTMWIDENGDTYKANKEREFKS